MHLSPRQPCSHPQYPLQVLLAVMTSIALWSLKKRVDTVVDMAMVDMVMVDMVMVDMVMVDSTSTVPHTVSTITIVSIALLMS